MFPFPVFSITLTHNEPPAHMYLVIRELKTAPPAAIICSTVYNEHKLEPIVLEVYHTLSAAQSHVEYLREGVASAWYHSKLLQQNEGFSVLEGWALIDPEDGLFKETVFVMMVAVG
jgi:hypothetical protein